MLESDFGLVQRGLAVLMLVVCAYPTIRYFSRRERGLPTVALLAGAFGIQFALPIFFHEQAIKLLGGPKYLVDADMIAALLLALAGICALQVGAFSFQRSSLARNLPAISVPLNKRRATAYCILVGVLVTTLLAFKDLIPDDYRTQVSAGVRFVEIQILVVIGILGWLVFSGENSKIYTVALYAVVCFSVIRGIAGGMLENAIVPMAVLFAIRWLYTRRLGLGMVIVAVILVMFLSPVKSEFRRRFWYGSEADVQQTSLTMVLEWFKDAGRYWEDTLDGRRDVGDATDAMTGRMDLIHQMAHIYSLTPSEVPYQYGRTYGYLGVALVPRMLWPGKPETGDANRFFAVDYGITTEEGARVSTFGVSLLGEAYINFGWPGVVLIMLIQGLILGLLQHVFGGERSGPGGNIVFLAVTVFLLNGIGQSADMMFGNIFQMALAGCLSLWWVRERSDERPSGFADMSVTGSMTARRGS